MKDNQFTVSLEITNNSDTFIGEEFYVMGNFNNWIPDALPLGKIPGFGEKQEYFLDHIEKGNLELKITRGSLSTLTSSDNGKLEMPYVAQVGKDTNIQIQIDGWRDSFPTSTATEQVHVLDEAFFLPELNEYREIWIYLPKDYHHTRKLYPVIYMHDGQHLFDEATSTGRTGPIEWEVDETIDESPNDAIVVAIASSSDTQTRHKDYLVHSSASVEATRGRQYLQALISTLKPHVDANYRTLSDAKNTAMAGSSLGGLLSIYAGLLYPHIFGTLGVFSPSIWIDNGKLYRTLDHILHNEDLSKYQKQSYYFYGGSLENRPIANGKDVDMMQNIKEFVSYLREKTLSAVQVSCNPNGKHGAWYWKEEFPRFYEWWHKSLL